MSGHYRDRWPRWLECYFCRKTFRAGRKDAKTCGPKCRQALKRLRDGEAQRLQARKK